MPRRRSWLSWVLCAVLAFNIGSFVLPAQSAKAAAGDLIINEINWGGSTASVNDEWVEIYSPSTGVPIDFAVTPYTLELRDAADIVLSVVTIGGVGAPVLNPGQYLVIHNNVPGTTLDTAAVGPVYYVPSMLMVLPDQATQYYLLDSTSVQVDALTRATPADPIPFAGRLSNPSSASASMFRVYNSGLPADPTLQTSWKTSTVLGANFMESAQQYGTPGAENIQMLVPSAAMVIPTASASAPALVNVTATLDPSSVKATLVVRREGPVPTENANVMAVSGSAYSAYLNLTPGRYTLRLSSEDVLGNQSSALPVQVSTSGELNYVVFATSSSVQSPVLTAQPAVTNQSTLTLSGTVAAGVTEVDIVQNGEFLQTVPVTAGSFNATVILKSNQINQIKAVAIATTGEVSLPTTVSILHDNQAPAVVDVSRVVVESHNPGVEDRIYGLYGAAEPGTRLTVYSDAAMTKTVAGPVLVDLIGSFERLLVGDNLYDRLYLRLADLAGNLSQAVIVTNQISFSLPASGLNLQTSVTQTTVKLTWNAVPGAVSYKVKYRTANGSYGQTTVVCNSSAPCLTETTIINLVAGTNYVVAVSALDKFWNETGYSELSFTTSQPVPVVVQPEVVEPVVAPAPVTTTPVKSEVKTLPAPTEEVSSTPSPSPSPEVGEVKSVATSDERNWTPWIVLGVILGLAILIVLGYLYWFGGAAGDAVLATTGSKSKVEKDAPAKDGKIGENGKKAPPKNKRW